MPLTIRNWESMAQFGIYFLTSEVDPYHKRALFDLSEKGEQIVKRFLGIPDDSKLYQNNNSGKGMKAGPAVSSIMLPLDSLAELAVAALMFSGAKMVLETHDDGIIGLMNKEDVEIADDYIKRQHHQIKVYKS